jgi:cytohesin
MPADAAPPAPLSVADEGLWRAVQAPGHRACVTFYLQQGADPAARRVDGTTPLHHAAKQGFADYLREMLSAGTKRRHARDQRDSTPLHEAARGGHAACVKHLLEGCEAPRLLRDCRGKTALQLAMAGKGDGHAKCVLLLQNRFGHADCCCIV